MSPGYEEYRAVDCGWWKTKQTQMPKQLFHFCFKFLTGAGGLNGVCVCGLLC